MKKIEVELNQETYSKIQQLAETHHCQISELIQAMIDQLTQPEILNDSFIGKWQDDAELVDQLIEDMLQNRTSQKLT